MYADSICETRTKSGAHSASVWKPMDSSTMDENEQGLHRKGNASEAVFQSVGQLHSQVSRK